MALPRSAATWRRGRGSERLAGNHPDLAGAAPGRGDLDLHRDAFLQFLDVAGHAHAAAAGVAVFKQGERLTETGGIERAEALVDEQAFDPHAARGRHFGKTQREREADEAFAARKVEQSAHFAGHVVVDHLNRHVAAKAARQRRARLQIGKPGVAAGLALQSGRVYPSLSALLTSSRLPLTTT